MRMTGKAAAMTKAVQEAGGERTIGMGNGSRRTAEDNETCAHPANTEAAVIAASVSDNIFFIVFPYKAFLLRLTRFRENHRSRVIFGGFSHLKQFSLKLLSYYNIPHIIKSMNIELFSCAFYISAENAENKKYSEKSAIFGVFSKKSYFSVSFLRSRETPDEGSRSIPRSTSLCFFRRRRSYLRFPSSL